MTPLPSLLTLDSDGVFRADILARIPGLTHGFGTRLSVDWPNAATAVVRQIHSDRVVVADAPGAHGEADALVTDQSGFLLAVRTADCVPILLVDELTHSVAAVHAGWRGTASQILPRALDKMSRQYGTRATDVLVAVGPAIGQCCFEVGPEVAVQFRRWFPERDDLSSKTKIDLAEANLRQLKAAGVQQDHIAVAQKCTRCDPELFHSWRRDAAAAGRMVAAIGWER